MDSKGASISRVTERKIENSFAARTLNAAPETKSADLTILRTSRTIMYVPY